MTKLFTIFLLFQLYFAIIHKKTAPCAITRDSYLKGITNFSYIF